MRRDLFYRQLAGKRQLEERIAPPKRPNKRRARSEVIILQSRPQPLMSAAVLVERPSYAQRLARSARIPVPRWIEQREKKTRARGPHLGWRMETMPGAELLRQEMKRRAKADEQYRRAHLSRLTEPQRHPRLPKWAATLQARQASPEGLIYLGGREIGGPVAQRFIKGGTFPVTVGRVKRFQTTGVLE